jgi:hypothetical protein
MINAIDKIEEKISKDGTVIYLYGIRYTKKVFLTKKLYNNVEELLQDLYKYDYEDFVVYIDNEPIAISIERKQTGRNENMGGPPPQASFSLYEQMKIFREFVNIFREMREIFKENEKEDKNNFSEIATQILQQKLMSEMQK